MTAEKEQGLVVGRNLYNQVDKVQIDPINFSKSALREMLRYQIFSRRPRAIKIFFIDSELFIPPRSLKMAKKYKGEKRREFLRSVVDEMQNAENVIFETPQIKRS